MQTCKGGRRCLREVEVVEVVHAGVMSEVDGVVDGTERGTIGSVRVGGIEDTSGVGVAHCAFYQKLTQKIQDVLLSVLGIVVVGEGIVGSVCGIDEQGELGERGVVVEVGGSVEGEKVRFVPMSRSEVKAFAAQYVEDGAASVMLEAVFLVPSRASKAAVGVALKAAGGGPAVEDGPEDGGRDARWCKVAKPNEGRVGEFCVAAGESIQVPAVEFVT